MKRCLRDTRHDSGGMTADAAWARPRNASSKSDILVSVASVWEMMQKNARGKPPLQQGAIVEQFVTQGFVLLPLLRRDVAVFGL